MTKAFDFIRDTLDAMEKRPRMWAFGLEGLELLYLELICLEEYLQSEDKTAQDIRIGLNGRWLGFIRQRYKDLRSHVLFDHPGMTHEVLVEVLRQFRRAHYCPGCHEDVEDADWVPAVGACSTCAQMVDLDGGV